WRRIAVSSCIGALITIAVSLISSAVGPGLPNFNSDFVLEFLIDVAFFAVSISATRRISSIIISLSKMYGAWLWLFLMLIVFHYALLILWRPAIDFVIFNLKMLVSSLLGITIVSPKGLSDFLDKFYFYNPFVDIPLTPRSLLQYFLHEIDVDQS